MLKDDSGNVIIAQFAHSKQEDFYNLVVTCEGQTGVYISTGCDPSGNNLGFEEVSGLHYPGSVIHWIDNPEVMWKSFIEVGMGYSRV